MSGRGSVKEISTKPRNTRKNMGRQARASGLNPSANSEVMMIREVADYLNCHLNTAYRLVNDRKIPSFKLGND
jgi:excisionase family DNA binding protein